MRELGRDLGALPLPGGERVGAKGFGFRKKRWEPPHPTPLRGVDLSPPGRGETTSRAYLSNVV